MELRIPLYAGPIIQSFDIDMNYGGLVFHFDQPVLANTLDVDRVFLHAHRTITRSRDIYNFTQSVFTNLTAQGNTTDVYFFMSTDDFARLVMHPTIAKSRNSVFLSLAYGAFNSSIGVPSEEVNSTHALPVSSFVNDTTSPYVVQFGLDMDLGVLTIDFSEPTDPSSFTLHGLAFQRKRNGLYDDAYVPLLHEDGCQTDSDYQRRITCDLGTANMNNIKRVQGLCTVINNTYLSAYAPFCNDHGGSPVSILGFERIFGMVATSYIADTTPPTLDSWDLDLNTGQATLHFSEVVYLPLFNYSDVIICNNATLSSSTVVMRVQDPIVTSYVSTEDVVIQLNPTQFNFIKYHENLATGNGSDTYLILEPFLAVDTSALENRYAGYDASENNARRVTVLTLDTISPELDHFEIDLSAQTLLLVFTEVVDISTLDFGEFVFQSSASVHPDTEMISYFDVSMLVTEEDSTDIVLDLTSLFEDIKSRSQLAQSLDTCFVAFTYRFVDDQSGNDVIQIPYNRARQATVFVADTQQPSLLSWTIDMGTAEIVLTFSEPVSTESLALSSLSIQSETVANSATIAVSLSSSEITDRVLSSVYIQLSYDDANRIKRSSQLCTTVETCFLQFGENFGFDVPSYTSDGITRNAILPLNTAMAPSVFTPDDVRPMLLSFNVDLALGKLHMYFTEPVNTRSINSTLISFYGSNASVSNFLLSLSAQSFSEYTDTASEEITLVLTRQDFFALKRNGVFDAVNNRLWMTVGNNTFFDSVGNLLDGTSFGEISQGVTESNNDLQFISPLTYFPDNSGPVIVALQSFRGSADRTNITIYFDDAVRVSTLVKSYVFIASFEAIKVLPLTTATLLTESSSVTSSLSLSLASMRTLISNTPPIFVDQSNSFVYLQSGGAIADAYGNKNLRMSSTAAVRSGTAVIRFLMNMDQGKLVLELAYPITFTLPNVDATEFKLMNTKTGKSYTLTSSFTSLEVLDRGYFIHLTLSSTDANNIRSNQLISKRTELQLEMTTRAIIHSSTVELGKTSVISCAQLIVDTTPPSVDYFYLNMGTGIMGIQFTEPVVVSSIDLTKISLGDAAVNAANTFRLKNAALVSTTAALTTTYLIEINLNAGSTYPTDRDSLHISDTIGLSKLKTNLILDPGFAHDTSVPPNYVTPIDVTSALSASTLLSDRTPPTLLSYDLDLTERKMKLKFSEAVNATTTKVTSFTLLGSPNAPTVNFLTLSGESVVSPATKALAATAEVTIDLSDVDVDKIMLHYPLLCTSSSDTHLAFPTGAIKDLAFSSNSIEQVFRIYARKVTSYVADTKRPVIRTFNVSMQSRRIDIYFDEMVNCFATDVGKVSFQSSAFIGTLTERYTLTATSSYLIGCEANNYITRSVTIYIGREDLIRIKSFLKLMKSAATTKLHLDQGAFMDVTGNMISGVRDGYALDVGNYERDSTSPRLLGFSVSTDRVMRVKFSEPIKVSSLDVTQIRIHNGRDPTISYQLKRTATTVGGVGRNLMTVRLDMARDYDYMVGVTNIFKRQNTSFLSVTSDCVTDTSGNPLVSISVENGLNMGPTITDWDLNLNTGELSLYFSHAVTPGFSINGVSIQDTPSDPSIEVLISSTPQAMSVIDNDFYDANTAFIVELSSIDITALKLSGLITPAGDMMYLNVPLGLSTSPVLNTIVPNILSTATLFGVQLGEFVFDRTGPVVTGIVLDLNVGVLNISFDEPVLGMSLDVSKIVLLSNAFGNSIALTHIMAPINVNASTLSIDIVDNDLNVVKYSHAIGTLDRVLFDIDFVADLFGNYAEGDDDLNGEKFIVDIDVFSPDTTDPQILSCFVDFSTSLITLQFDEIIDSDSIKPYNIEFYSANHTAPRIRNLTLSNYSIVEVDLLRLSGNVTVDMSLYRQDAFDFQAQAVIGKNSSVTFVRVSGATDVSGNPHDSSVVVACQIGDDTDQPVLESFDFISNGGNYDVTLYFSEVLDISSFDCADVEFATLNSQSAAETVSLTSGDCTVSTVINSREVTFSVAAALFSTIGSAPSATWVYAPNPLSTADISGNILQALPVTSAHRVGPRVVDFLLNMQDGEAVLIFSRDIDLSATFNSSGVGFSSLTTGNTYFLEEGTASLAGYFIGADNAEFVVSIGLVASNLNGVKSIDIDKNTAVLVLRENIFIDTDGTPSPLLDRGRRITPARFVKDEQSPQIQNLEIDMSLNKLTFTFDEPIRTSTVAPKKMTLQAMPGSLSQLGLVSYSLTGGTLRQNLDGDYAILAVSLTDFDSGNIKLLPNISKDAASVFLSLGYTPMEDMAGNSLATIFPSSARPFDDFVVDTKAPVLQSFVLDMNIGEIRLNFSEPIDASSVNTSQITLQSRFSRGLEGWRYLTLTADSEVISENGFVITISIGPTDMYRIKNTNNLARKRISTYLSAPSSAAKDLAGNEMVRIIDGEALPVKTFIRDSTSPRVVDIKLDMTSETLTFYFSELIWTMSANVAGAAIQQSAVVGFGYNYSFTSASNTLANAASQFSTSLIFKLGSADVNGIKWRRPLGSTQEYSYFIVTSALCYDVFTNPVEAISGFGMRAGSYVADFEPPVLLHYTLDMNALTVNLEYSESVLQDSITLEQGILQRTETKRFGNSVNLSFTSAQVGKDLASNFVIITIDPKTSYEMKWYRIAVSLDSSFFSWGSEFITDGFGNYIDPLWDGSVLGK